MIFASKSGFWQYCSTKWLMLTIVVFSYGKLSEQMAFWHTLTYLWQIEKRNYERTWSIWFTSLIIHYVFCLKSQISSYFSPLQYIYKIYAILKVSMIKRFVLQCFVPKRIVVLIRLENFCVQTLFKHCLKV